MLKKSILEKGKKISGAKTDKKFIEIAVKEYLNKKERQKIIELEGKIKWEGDLNKMREKRF